MTLDQIGVRSGTDKSSLYHGYLDFYQKHLPKHEPEKIFTLMEVGIKDGASLRMWREFYPNAQYIGGMDIEPRFDIEGCRTFQADATLKSSWKDFWPMGFNVIIDDGSHLCSAQRKVFEICFYGDILKPGGFLILEDVHTSFLADYADESPTTYEWAMKIPEAIEYWRDPSNKTDSGTIIIKKQ